MLQKERLWKGMSHWEIEIEKEREGKQVMREWDTERVRENMSWGNETDRWRENKGRGMGYREKGKTGVERIKCGKKRRESEI